MNSNYISIGHAADLIGVSVKSLRRWEQKRKLLPAFRTAKNHRRYDIKSIYSFIGKKSTHEYDVELHQCAIYARVSSHRQMKSGDLKRQIQQIENYGVFHGYTIKKVYKDVGSGLNDKRKGLMRLLKDATLGKFSKVLVNYNDRLARFGLGIIKEFLLSWKVDIEVVQFCIRLWENCIENEEKILNN